MSGAPLGDVVSQRWAGCRPDGASPTVPRHSGSITVLTEEAEHPYDRPLSKDVLLGQDSSPTVLLSPGKAKSSGIDVRLSHRVTGLDLEKKMVAVPDGPPLAYGSLGIADRHARSLPHLHGINGVHHPRTLADTHAIREWLTPGSRITIAGAGFIGLEVAAAARASGCAVTVVELAPSRSTDPSEKPSPLGWRSGTQREESSSGAESPWTLRKPSTPVSRCASATSPTPRRRTSSWSASAS
ncbi:hypothetical protein DDE18_04460 [Nocardioides gansuensis]|uniref:FAD/NAD(P)-binding domain-containing protein n=1 Tax=Nocardioides gansuensis TaxID=2138300 RepID=A0A2T8FD15_9ACTN|nr:FAD/NAD(P)-binding oxidoreductase [Nocardioides gansuensis]PVG83589.1 hypothetical protein DDE18_04460 [Nocardioides gansuensis]